MRSKAAIRPLAATHVQAAYLPPSHIRLAFANGLSNLYSKEVPQFKKLKQLVQRINDTSRPEARVKDPLVPRHGAVRLASLSDLQSTARLLGVMGMRPVGYYDLSTVGLPIHATAFRSLVPDDLSISPIRFFVSVLRPETQEIPLVKKMLQARSPIFNERTLQLVVNAEEQGGLSEQDGVELAESACRALQWDGEASVSAEDYNALKKEEAGNLLVDILGFGSPHINHLTPATGNIDAVQEGMSEMGLVSKDRVEGPPARKCPVLLRQTSFLAVEETVSFPGSGERESHTARFGEVEQRGAALTKKGRETYDEIISLATKRGFLAEATGQEEYRSIFNKAFPDDWQALKDEGLIWVKYSLTGSGQAKAASAGRGRGLSIGQALRDGLVTWQPIQYEDFLPLSAAGIFQSNLGGKSTAEESMSRDDANTKQEMQKVLPGGGMLDEMELYAIQEAESLRHCCESLGIS